MRYLPLNLLILIAAGCSALPDIAHQPQIRNPFPQLSRVAVLPFYNQSAEPTVDQDEIALAYYNELQAIPGFEVVPVGVTKRLLTASGIDPRSPRDFQRLARYLDVDAIVVGSVTEFDAYYPPRMGLSVRWYAANPGFHPIPPGYGLPWGTAEEEFIPESLVYDAEFALAREQLETQTPKQDELVQPGSELRQTSVEQELPPVSAAAVPSESDANAQPADPSVTSMTDPGSPILPLSLPADWPDPRGFIPPPPAQTPPDPQPQFDAVMSHTKLYHGNDAEFTKRLSNYFYFRDDARFGDWQAYLTRTSDFIRFCCHLHVTEMLAARGGAGESRVVWRWPIGRYDR